MTANERVRELIEQLGLEPHPEGGSFRQVYRSPRLVIAGSPPEPRAALTTIYFLLTAGQHSAWHRVAADEVWHFYEGEPLEQFVLSDFNAQPVRQVLGPAGPDASPVAVVPGGAWQASRSLGAYTLMGCTVAPGFEYSDLTLLRNLPRETGAFRRRFPDLAQLL
jgi:predicted cupin superfamily sugar epimerase